MPLSLEEIEALRKKKQPRDKRPAYLRQLEDPEGLEAERLERIRERYPLRQQIGPVRFRDTEDNCANRGCTTRTSITIQGIRRCPSHALPILNEMLVNKGVLS